MSETTKQDIGLAIFVGLFAGLMVVLLVSIALEVF